MYCYYQGEMEVTGGTEVCLLSDVVATVKVRLKTTGYVHTKISMIRK